MPPSTFGKISRDSIKHMFYTCPVISGLLDKCAWLADWSSLQGVHYTSGACYLGRHGEQWFIQLYNSYLQKDHL